MNVKTIAVPMMDGSFSTHFGGASSFALYEVDETTGTVSAKGAVAPPEHGRGVFPAWLRGMGADVILAGGMGPRAVGIFAQHGIEVVLGVEPDEPETLVQSWLDGTLRATGEPCNDHGFHDCDHHEGRRHGRAGRH